MVLLQVRPYLPASPAQFAFIGTHFRNSVRGTVLNLVTFMFCKSDSELMLRTDGTSWLPWKMPSVGGQWTDTLVFRESDYVAYVDRGP